jgi:hypothetical protein
MAKPSDLIGKSGAGGLGPLSRGAKTFSTSTEGEKEAPKAGQGPKKNAKSMKGGAKAKGGGASTTSPSVRPKV